MGNRGWGWHAERWSLAPPPARDQHATVVATVVYLARSLVSSSRRCRLTTADSWPPPLTRISFCSPSRRLFPSRFFLQQRCRIFLPSFRPRMDVEVSESSPRSLRQQSYFTLSYFSIDGTDCRFRHKETFSPDRCRVSWTTSQRIKER